MTQRVATHLMFSGEASAALALYESVFADFRVHHLERYEDGQAGPPGSVQRADIVFGEHRLIAFDSPVKHAFTFTPAVSLFVDFDSADALDAAFSTLSDGGGVLMPIGEYGFSRRFGWCTDRFGVSWQLNLP